MQKKLNPNHNDKSVEEDSSEETTKTQGNDMKYRVHRLEVNKDNMHEKLERLLNGLDGDVVAVMPNVRPFFLFYGVQVDFVMVVEKLK
jgi:hypothetical protein